MIALISAILVFSAQNSFQIAFKNLKASWQIFSSDLLSNFWKQIAGKFLKANRWKIFESFLKANRWKIFESKSLAKFWKLAGEFFPAICFQNFESLLLAKFWKLWNRWRTLDNENLLSKFWKLEASFESSERSKFRHLSSFQNFESNRWRKFERLSFKKLSIR